MTADSLIPKIRLLWTFSVSDENYNQRLLDWNFLSASSRESPKTYFQNLLLNLPFNYLDARDVIKIQNSTQKYTVCCETKT